jgi:cysteinyl-tRNA synthetase
MIESGKQARSLMQGSRYSKCFTAKEQAIEHALMALERRAASLRDNAIVTTQKTAGRVESVVNQVAVTGSRVDLRTKTTLRQVQNLQREAKDLRFVAEHTDTQLSSVATGIQTFTQTQDTINVKIDDLHGVQRATHSQVETLSDVQQAKTQAAKAMEIALETAECKPETPKCPAIRLQPNCKDREGEARPRHPSVEETAEQTRANDRWTHTSGFAGYAER